MGTFLLYILMVFALSSLAVVAMLLIRRHIGGDALRRNHEVAGFVYSVVGAIFAVTVALMIDTVHDEYMAAEKCAISETIQISTIYTMSDWFPENGGGPLKQKLKKYVDSVVGSEWPRMNNPMNRLASETETAFLEVAVALRAVKPDTVQQQAVYQEMIQRFSSLSEFRYGRVYGSRFDLPFPIWFVVIFGGLITIGFSLFFTMHSTKSQALMIFFVSAMIWSNILIIAEVHYPFNGITVTPPKAMLLLQSRF